MISSIAKDPKWSLKHDKNELHDKFFLTDLIAQHLQDLLALARTFSLRGSLQSKLRWSQHILGWSGPPSSKLCLDTGYLGCRTYTV